MNWFIAAYILISKFILLSEVTLKQFALLAFESAYSFLFDLTNTFTGQVKFISDFFEGHFLATDAKEHLDYFTLAIVELAQGTIHLF